MNRDILGFLFLVLSIVIAILFFSPKVQEVRSITIDKEAKATLVASRDKRIASLKQIQAAFAQQPDRIKKLAAVLPSEPQVPEVMVSLEAMAKEAGVALDSVSPQVNTQDSSVFMSLVGEGSLVAVEGFSKLIAQNARPMSVVSVSLLRSQDGSAISFTMTVRAPYNNPELQVEAATADEETL